jgi:hypothetical protein
MDSDGPATHKRAFSPDQITGMIKEEPCAALCVDQDADVLADEPGNKVRTFGRDDLFKG